MDTFGSFLTDEKTLYINCSGLQDINLLQNNDKIKIVFWCNQEQNFQLIINKNELVNFEICNDYNHELISKIIWFQNLEQIIYTFCKIDKIPSFELLNNIKLINLSHNNLNFFPVLCDENKLENLDMSFNKLDSIPEKIEKYPNLKHLLLSNNNINYIHKSIKNLDKLEYLDIQSNMINYSINEILSFSNLIEFNCNNNKITELDCSQLINLKQLYCSNNELNELIVDKLTNLEILNCNKNKLEKLQLSKNLRELKCNNNKLTYLDLSNMSNLKLFWCIENNNLEKINGLCIKQLNSLLLEKTK